MTSATASSAIHGRSGAGLFIEVLQDEGVRHIFGNPGTTELPLLGALTDTTEIDYVLGLQEVAVVAMADGYAQASGRPGVVNLHTAGGLGHAIGAIVNARMANTPLVITAGQQDTRHRILDPLLGGDLVAMARPNVKWAEEVHHPDHLPVLLRRALQDCRTGPAGPVFLSLPMDTMEGDAAVGAGTRSRIARASLAPSLDELAETLAGIAPGRIAVIVGEEVFAARAGAEVVDLAEELAAPVFGSSWPGHIPFPTAHPQWRGTLPPSAADMRRELSAYDALLLLGGHALISYLYSEGSPVPAHCRLFQLNDEAHQIGRFHQTELGLAGALRPSLEALLPLLRRALEPQADRFAELRKVAAEGREERRRAAGARAAGEFDAATTTPFVAAHEVVRAVGHDIPIVDEAPATIPHVRACLDSFSARQYMFNRGGILGWGMPAAVGTALGLDRSPVVCLVGDGSALYAPQALWTAAHEDLPVTFVVMNNRSYEILKGYSRGRRRSTAPGRMPGLDLVDPEIDFVALAQSFGVSARRVENARDIAAAVEDGIRSGRPNLIDLPIAAGFAS